MTLDEAKSELQHQCCVPNSVFLTPPYQARALGIEALKRILKERNMGAGADWGHLPGETKE